MQNGFKTFSNDWPRCSWSAAVEDNLIRLLRWRVIREPNGYCYARKVNPEHPMICSNTWVHQEWCFKSVLFSYTRMQYLIWELQYAQYTPLKQFFDRDTLVLGNAIAYKNEQIFKGTEIEFRDNLFYNSLVIFFIKFKNRLYPHPASMIKKAKLWFNHHHSYIFKHIKGTYRVFF